jgi:predicted transcriptional regulator
MDKKLTVEFRDDDLYNELSEIAELCHETPEALLVRAFREWVDLREDLEDVEYARRALEEYDREGGISHEELGKQLGTRRRRSA